jgi:hypothetical protein
MRKLLVNILCLFVPVRKWRHKIRAVLRRQVRPNYDAIIADYQRQVEYLIAARPKLEPYLLPEYARYRRKFLGKGGAYEPCYENPRTLSEKIIWYYLHYYKHSAVSRVIRSKIHAKKYLADVVGKDYVIETYAVYKKPGDIDFAALPNQFILKAQPGAYSREILICRDKSKLNIRRARKTIRGWGGGREYIAEMLLSNPDGCPIVNYKFFASGGNIVCCFTSRSENPPAETGNVYEMDSDENLINYYEISADGKSWKMIGGLTHSGHKIGTEVPQPESLPAMVDLTRKISAPFGLIRIDFYYVDGMVYIGEMTAMAGGGVMAFSIPDYDFEFGRRITLPAEGEIQERLKSDYAVADKYLNHSGAQS